MDTNKNVQETLDLQVEDPINIEEESQTKDTKPKKKGTVKKKSTQKDQSAKSEEFIKEDTDEVKNVVEEIKNDEEKNSGEPTLEECNIATEEENPTLIAEEGQQPIVEDIKRFKLFFVSDMDEEAIYLHEMSLKGYHFVSKKGMQYIFRQGEPKNYYYHLGYYEKDKRDGARYLDNYIEAGWENIYHEKAEFDGVWNYFRIEMPIGEPEPNIFSDRVSRLALYKRLLSSWRTLLAVDIICFFFTIFVYIFLTNHPMNMTNVYKTLCAVLDVVIVLIFIIYLRAYLKISHKQHELEKI